MSGFIQAGISSICVLEYVHHCQSGSTGDWFLAQVHTRAVTICFSTLNPDISKKTMHIKSVITLSVTNSPHEPKLWLSLGPDDYQEIMISALRPAQPGALPHCCCAWLMKARRHYQYFCTPAWLEAALSEQIIVKIPSPWSEMLLEGKSSLNSKRLQSFGVWYQHLWPTSPPQPALGDQWKRTQTHTKSTFAFQFRRLTGWSK